MVDFCKTAEISELEDGTAPEFDDSSCQARGTIPPFNEYLNVNTPLQIGGRYVEDFDPTLYHWQFMPYGKGFDGCIRNVFHNSKVRTLLTSIIFNVLNCPNKNEDLSEYNCFPSNWQFKFCFSCMT